MIKRKQITKTRANKFAVCLFLIFVAGFCWPRHSYAAPAVRPLTAVDDDEKTVTLNITQRTLVYILSEIKKQTGLNYGFKDSQNANREEYFSINVRRVSVE